MERLRAGDPEQIGPWQIVNRLGAGGMGIVYMGTNGTRAAAIKIVRDFLLEDPSSRTRLAREVTSLKKVKSKYVAEIVGADIDANPAWIATNYVDGPSLKTLIENEGPLSELQWFELATGLMSGLAGVHSVGVIHRDVKPSNVLMSATGPRLIDFGISFSSDATALTRTGMVAGTPTWFAPEQFQNTKITTAVDNFAAGSILFFAATGTSPWGKEDTSVANTMNQILNKDPDLNLLTENQRVIIGQLLDKNPKNRISAQDCAGLIEGIRESAGLTHNQNPQGISGLKKKIAIAAAVVIALGAFAFTQISGNGESSTPVAAPSPTVTPKPMWAVYIVGDPTPQTGTGKSFSFYLCDQAVIDTSLKLKELTNPPATPAPTAKVISGDARCGSEFDTIVVTGPVNFNKGKRSYVLAGSTRAGFLIQYEFDITKKQN
jgi:serine/threonine protein kinase